MNKEQEINGMANIPTEQEKKEIQKTGKEIDNLINEIKPFANAIDSEVIGTHLYEVGYGKVEDYKKEITRLKEENENLKSSQFSDKEIFLIIQCNRQQAIKEFAEKLKLKVSIELAMINGRFVQEISMNRLSDIIADLLKEYGIGEE